MTKKDYQAIAREIYETGASAFRTAPAGQAAGVEWTLHTVADKLADVMAADNPRFDRERFIEACETGTTRGMRKKGGR